jgi:hypothetical protein
MEMRRDFISLRNRERSVTSWYQKRSAEVESLGDMRAVTTNNGFPDATRTPDPRPGPCSGTIATVYRDARSANAFLTCRASSVLSVKTHEASPATVRNRLPVTGAPQPAIPWPCKSYVLGESVLHECLDADARPLFGVQIMSGGAGGN